MKRTRRANFKAKPVLLRWVLPLFLLFVLVYALIPSVGSLPQPASYSSQAQHHLREIQKYWDQFAMRGPRVRDPENIGVLRDEGLEIDMLVFRAANERYYNRAIYVPGSLRDLKASEPEGRILLIYKYPFDMSNYEEKRLGQKVVRFMALTAYSEILYLESPPEALHFLFEGTID